jgi:hypothetical protein
MWLTAFQILQLLLLQLSANSAIGAWVTIPDALSMLIPIPQTLWTMYSPIWQIYHTFHKITISLWLFAPSHAPELATEQQSYSVTCTHFNKCENGYSNSEYTYFQGYLWHLIGLTVIHCRNIFLGATHNNSTDTTTVHHSAAYNKHRYQSIKV